MIKSILSVIPQLGVSTMLMVDLIFYGKHGSWWTNILLPLFIILVPISAIVSEKIRCGENVDTVVDKVMKCFANIVFFSVILFALYLFMTGNKLGNITLPLWSD